MTDYAQATLPLQARDNRSLFLEHAWNIGRAYRNRAIELISIYQFISRLAPPKRAQEYAELRRYETTPRFLHSFVFLPLTFSCRMCRLCDLALRSAADSGTKVTNEADARFSEAIQMLSSHSARIRRL